MSTSFCEEISILMKREEMKSKLFWLTLDLNQAISCDKIFDFALPSFLLEDQLKQNIKVSKRALTLIHRCTAGVFEEYKRVCQQQHIELGNQLPGEEATKKELTQQQILQSLSGREFFFFYNQFNPPLSQFLSLDFDFFWVMCMLGSDH
jgi:hypothetical protein